MNFKKYHVSKNLFDKNTTPVLLYYQTAREVITQTAGVVSVIMPVSPNTTYTFNNPSGNRNRICETETVPEVNDTVINYIASDGDVSITLTTSNNTHYILWWVGYQQEYSNIADALSVNLGSTPQPYEPYSSEVWHDTSHYIMGTSTDTITTLPADIYANDTTATVGLKGNMSQSSTPTPSSPIQPSECGDLETEGTHAGQYKIPILSANTTTPVYLGEVETTRKIKKLVLTGEETSYSAIAKNIFSIRGVFNQAPELLQVGGFCTHYKYNNAISSLAQNMSNGDFVLNKIVDDYSFTIRDNSFSNDTNFKQYVQQQYAANTPVTIWYVLATPETAVVNEPIRKIGDYADEVANVSIPVTAGTNTIDIDTTLKPSEVSVNYKGWHPVADVHEAENGAWT